MKTLPPLGFGTGQIPDGDACVMAVLHALEAGYRLIDTAAHYGNEPSVGRAIAESGLRREALAVISKLSIVDKGYDAAIRACKESLERLGLDYLDVYLIHWPANAVANPQDWRELNASSWRGLEYLYEAGLVRTIGLSNFMPEHLEPLLAGARIAPQINQIELHPGHAQLACRQYCAQRGIALQAWSPMGMGGMELLEHPLVMQIAGYYEKTTAQLCLRWCVQCGAVPLPKSVTPERIVENSEIFDFEISEEHMRALDELPALAYSGWDPYSMPTPS